MTRVTRVALLIAVLASCKMSNGYRFLVDFHFPGKSHSILGTGVTDALLEAGHEVTIITPILRKDPPKNLRQIDVSENFNVMTVNMLNLTEILNKESSLQYSKMFDIMKKLGQSTLSNDNVVKLLNDPSEKFDAIISEWMFVEAFIGLGQVFDCPFIWLSSVEPHWMVTSLIDEQLNPSYNPSIMSSNVPPFSFTQRVTELGVQILVQIMKQFVFASTDYDIYAMFGPIVAKKGKELAPFEVAKYTAALMLGNSHVSLGQATRLPQNYKSVAGFHINPNLELLPEDLKKLLDNSKNGLIYFSMGSNLKSKEMPDKLKKSLLKMFGELKYDILWKFEEDFPDQPKNVHIINWAPQHSILAHPNCVLFITHGGLLSTTETVHFGVPIIGIPVFADQFMNVERSVKKGYAKRVDLAYDMADHLRIAIDDILTNPSYRKKVKELSLVYHDRLAPPRKELAHWVQHVVRTRGAPHLRSPALLVPWYQKCYLDLAAVVVAAFIVLKSIFKRLFCRKNKSSKQTLKTDKKYK